MKNVVIDVKATLGDLFYVGAEEVYEYQNNRRTTKVIGYNYNLVSSIQGDTVKVKVLGDKKEFKLMQPVDLVSPEVRIYATVANEKYANVNYAISSSDLVAK